MPSRSDADAVDAVVLWVDGADPAHRAALRTFRRRSPFGLSGANRFRDNGELRYALRSIDLHMPWLRRINLVTSGQAPAWLDPAHPRVRVVPHAAFFRRQDDLPTFNSCAIEANFAGLRRAGLARRFIAFNDDVFVGRPTTPEDFILPDGGLKLFALAWALPRARILADTFHHQLVSNRLLLSLAFGRKPWRYPPHAPIIYDLDDLAWLARRFALWFKRTSRHRFRRRSDVLVHMLYANALAERDRHRAGGARPVILPPPVCEFIPLRDDAECMARLARLGRETPPLFFCINDETADDVAAARAGEAMRAALERLFPGPAPFERVLPAQPASE